MIIYDVYEELEKLDEDEILFINNVLDGKVGFSSYEEVGHIFPKSYIIKNDNSDVIIDGVSCKNVISLNMVDKFQLEEEVIVEADCGEFLIIRKIGNSMKTYDESSEWGNNFYSKYSINNQEFTLIVNGGSCVNVASTDMNDTSFESDLDVESIESDLIVLGKHVEMVEYDQISSLVNSSLAKFVKASTKGCQVQEGDLIAELCGRCLFFKDDVSSSYRRASIEHGSDWKIRCKMKGEQNICEWMVMPLIKFDVNYVKFNLENDYHKDLRTSPKIRGGE